MKRNLQPHHLGRVPLPLNRRQARRQIGNIRRQYLWAPTPFRHITREAAQDHVYRLEVAAEWINSGPHNENPEVKKELRKHTISFLDLQRELAEAKNWLRGLKIGQDINEHEQHYLLDLAEAADRLNKYVSAFTPHKSLAQEISAKIRESKGKS